MSSSLFIAAVSADRRVVDPPSRRVSIHTEATWATVGAYVEPARWVIAQERSNSGADSQPVSHGPGSAWIAGVADLHNREALDTELERHGEARNRTDLDRILTGITHFGTDWLLRLRGPFGVVLSTPKGKLLAIRDQMGVCPLYYMKCDHVLYVANDLRVLTELDHFEPELDPVGLAHAVSGLWGDPAATAWKRIRRLPAGHVASSTGAALAIRDYWSPASRIRLRTGSDFRDYAAELAHHLERAVARWLKSDRVALELSGGMDSSTIAGFAAKNSVPGKGRPLALTWDLSERVNSDRSFAEAVVKMHDLEWKLVPTGASSEGARDRASRWRDLPGNYLWDEAERAHAIAREWGAARYLTGHLGDLVLVGEPWAALMQYVFMGNAFFVFKHSHYGRSLLSNFREIVRKHPTYTQMADRVKPLRNQGILHPDLWAAAGFDRRTIWPNPLDREAAVRSRVEQLRSPQHQRVIELTHRIGAESGLIVGHPLVDVDLVEFVAAVPPAYFVGSPANRVLHIAAAAQVLPRSVANRPDKGDFTWSALDAVRSQQPDLLLEHSYLAERGWIDRNRAKQLSRRVLGDEFGGPSGYDFWHLIGLVETEVFLQNEAKSIRLT